MGGLGSGRTRTKSHRWVERYWAFDLTELRRQGILGTGVPRLLLWRDGNKALGMQIVLASDDEIILGNERFALSRTPGGFGGSRLWLVCQCRRRVRVLYHSKRGGGATRCRHCLNLRYRSQSEPAHVRALWLAQKLKQQVYQAAGDYRKGIDEYEFGPKPQRMRQKTYERLFDRYVDLSIAFSRGQDEALRRGAISLNARDIRRDRARRAR